MPKKRYHVNKKIILLIITIILLFTIMIGMVIAYYVNSDKNSNQFIVGENENKITERFNPPSEQIANSNKYQKQVQVENTGSVPCYVRVYVSFSDSQILNYSKFSDDEILTESTTFYSANPSAENSFAKYLQGNNNSGKWTYIETDTNNSNLNGYYYYTEPIAPNESTEPLFRWIDTDYDNNGNAIQQYEVLVYLETVQTLDTNGNTYTGDSPWKSAWEEFLQKNH
ncbi:MAG: hypothetical protein ACI4WH_05280 [Oscillospiraceae bacterium]